MTRLSRRSFLSLAALPVIGQPTFTLTASDDLFLEDLSRRASLFFWEQADPRTGLVLDRARADGTQRKDRTLDVASTAATGFGLTALCIAAERRWIDRNEVQNRVRTTLRHLRYDQPNHLGWLYHFVDRKSGERVWKCELSTIDTALLLAGALTAQQCFSDDAEIGRLAQELYQRTDFAWMFDEESGFLRMAWKPETGFLRAAWTEYRENVILHILAVGSPTFPIPVRSWYRFERDLVIFGAYRFIGRGPIFTHQFPQAWLDLAGLRDGAPLGIDYFRNSAVATWAHRAFCLSLRGMYPTFSENLWGITPSDSDIGYLSWGSMFSPRDIDGTVVPCASAGSLMFAPGICLPALRTMQEEFGEAAYGRYGFADAFQPITGWVNPDVVAIDQGITLLSAENLRSRRVWNWFGRVPGIRRAIGRIFQPATAFGSV